MRAAKESTSGGCRPSAVRCAGHATTSSRGLGIALARPAGAAQTHERRACRQCSRKDGGCGQATPPETKPPESLSGCPLRYTAGHVESAFDDTTAAEEFCRLAPVRGRAPVPGLQGACPLSLPAPGEELRQLLRI